jgi:hypothetical protein
MKEAERGLALYARRRGASYGQIAHARGGSSNSYHANWTYVCRVNGGPPAEPDLAEAAPDDPRQP